MPRKPTASQLGAVRLAAAAVAGARWAERQPSGRQVHGCRCLLRAHAWAGLPAGQNQVRLQEDVALLVVDSGYHFIFAAHEHACTAGLSAHPRWRGLREARLRPQPGRHLRP